MSNKSNLLNEKQDLFKIKTWDIDYNIRTSIYSEEWRYHSRKNKYVFATPQGRTNVNYFIDKYSVKSIIDYGCGYGEGIDNSQVPVFYYDPFVEQFKLRPSTKADMVVCYNVLNIIEPEYLTSTINDICELSENLILLNIMIDSKIKPAYYQSFIDNGFKLIEGKTLPIKEWLEITGKNGKLSRSNAATYLLFKKGNR